MAKIVACGGDYSKIRFTFQEYFRRMTEDPERWSQPFAALLGAYKAQIAYGLPSIGGKDSMSGTFEHIDVVSNAFSFERIQDKDESNNMEWQHRWWGHSNLPEIKVLSQENDLDECS